MAEPLAFYDHHRQSYWSLEIKTAAEFHIGGYGEKGSGVDQRGEFTIALHRLSREHQLHPKVSFFGDAVGALQDSVHAGLLNILTPVDTRDEFTERLLSLGLRDHSDHPRDWTPGRCPECKQTVR